MIPRKVYIPATLIVFVLGLAVLPYLSTWAKRGPRALKTRNLSSSISVTVTVTSGKSETLLPKAFSLSQNYPNPFNPETVIRYTLPEDCHVELILYNILGQKVKMLVDEHQSAGYKMVRWDSRDDEGDEVASGIYLYRIEANGFVDVKKMAVLK
jgi:flagellar hook assembly protein FlgD